MRYFERLRMSVRPENGRCGAQPQYSIMFEDKWKYFCDKHYRITMGGHSDIRLADGETMGCDYEVGS